MTNDAKMIADGAEMAAMIECMADGIAEEFSSRVEDLRIIGLQKRGVPLAERLSAALEKRFQQKIPTGKLDISMYRDDIGMRKSLPLIRETSINFDIEKRVVILADDVMQAGRSVRAALDAITDFGRPAITRLAILIDRGKHEFPIAADYTGKAFHYDESFKIKVRWNEIDSYDSVEIQKYREYL
ncbi:MAG: bifunctional pyr operon transcriptional regulator/uracil phosphoribosyltransferase PyrR [Lentisphaeria bacterium]|nr:bifunctional pyr operon transcriptional regulator/uracil phosphoribosyltransferase PyrR [Lentisphaeria bacterium]